MLFRSYVYAMRLKQFVFSDEIVDTGIEEVDEQIFDLYRRTHLPFSEVGNNTRYLLKEIVYQGPDLANATAQALGYEVKREVGVSAQDVERVMPEIVAPAPIDEQYMTVRYERLVPLLIEAIKELRAEVNDIKSKL